jgi:SAM-dependent methyltransferase
MLAFNERPADDVGFSMTQLAELPTEAEPAGLAEFDAFAAQYDAALQQGIAASGENKDYFARGRLVGLARRLRQLQFKANRVLDFGCGTGSAAPFLLECLQAQSILGVDISEGSLQIARREHGAEKVSFQSCNAERALGSFDLAFCNGVFHHIPLAERAEAVRYVWESLRSGGLFAFWENNPWNPGTRYVMSRIPFDRDAITLSPPNARQLLTGGGFEVLRTDFQFIFPRQLAAFRPLERLVSRVPIGAQYQVLCRKA